MSDDLTFAQRRDRVRDGVIRPLEGMGLRKPKRMTVDQFEAFKVRLAERLAWLSPEWHDPLVEIIQRNAEPCGRVRASANPPRDLWPSEAAILNWARRLSPMGEVSRLVGTFMRSRAGREAWDHSPCLASRLEDHLRRYGQPPDPDGGMARLREQADNLARQIADTEALVARGEGTPDDAARLAAWEGRKAWLRDLIHGDLDRDRGLFA